MNIHNKLTFQSQLDLKIEFDNRNIQENISDLVNTINKKKAEIANLDYLKNIGFSINKIDDTIKIKRTSKAILIDIVAIILGIVFCVIGLSGISGLINLFSNDNEFNLFSLIMKIGMLAIGVCGIKMLNGFKRLIDFSGFELLSNKGNITLKKRFDVKLEEINGDEPLIELKEQSQLITLNLDDNNILNIKKSNIIQKMTITELSNQLAGTLYKN